MIDEPFITENELEDLLDYERHEHLSDGVVRKILETISVQMKLREKKVLTALKKGEPKVTILFWKAFNYMVDEGGMRQLSGRINRVSFCESCNAFHLWYNPLNSNDLNPIAVRKKLIPAPLRVELIKTH